MLPKCLTFCLVASLIEGYIVNPGPAVLATKGGVWPLPQSIDVEESYYTIAANEFQFKFIGGECLIIEKALRRYWNIINAADQRGKSIQRNALKNVVIKENSNHYLGRFESLEVELLSQCKHGEYPTIDMDESYKLNIASGAESSLRANTVWGLLRGLETFSQMIYLNNNYNQAINVTNIKDFPRFPHRGLLLDTSRHFVPVSIILDNLEAMAYNKLNVFHWHIVDDQSFPYQSIRFPEMSNQGAYHPVLQVYSQDDIKTIIEFARERGIRVMPEFDTPGHTRSWGEGVKNILTACYKNGEPTGQYGPMDPTKASLYEFLEVFFEEVINVFPDEYMHLGGDEVEFECWKSNPNILDFMKNMNMTGKYAELESYYIQKLINIVTAKKAKSLVWEEVFVNGVDVPNNTFIHVWKNDGLRVLKKKPALLSACWYLDHISGGGDWAKFYKCDPHNFRGTAEELALVKGGEACMWAESVNEYNVMPRIWPRASAAAEKLWSMKDADTYSRAATRLEEHTCRMNARGIPAQPPNGPGFCL